MVPNSPNWPPPPGADPGMGPGRIVVNAKYFPLAFLYALLSANITINGYMQTKPWGTYYYDLPAGDYEVAVSYPWAFLRECGRNSVRFRLNPGETRTVTYTAPLIRYLPGSIRVS